MKINIWSNANLRRKLGWFLVLMIWIGMVTAVVIHQTPEVREKQAKVSPEPEDVEINTKPVNSDSVEDKSIKVDTSLKSLDVQKVEKKAEKKGKDFFVEYRIERDQARSEQINLLREMINNPNSDKELKTKAQKKLLQITDNIEKEMEIESLIRARGYKDGIAFIHDNSVEIIVAAEDLKKEDVAKIGDIVANTTGISLKNITIIEKPPE